MKECNYNTADPVADKISIPTNITNVHDNNSNHSKKWLFYIHIKYDILFKKFNNKIYKLSL